MAPLPLPVPYIPGEPGSGLGDPNEFADNVQQNFDALASAVGSDVIGAWQTWTPTLSGWSANPASGIYRYCQIGKFVVCVIHQPTSGTSNATTVTISAPVPSVNVSGLQWYARAVVVNGGTVSDGAGYVAANSSTIAFYPDFAGVSTWSASGDKRVNDFTVIYEAA